MIDYFQARNNTACLERRETPHFIDHPDHEREHSDYVGRI
jgi:hypothetical protein